MLSVRSSMLLLVSLLALAACERSGPAKAPATVAENPAPPEEHAPAEAMARSSWPRRMQGRHSAAGAMAMAA